MEQLFEYNGTDNIYKMNCVLHTDLTRTTTDVITDIRAIKNVTVVLVDVETEHRETESVTQMHIKFKISSTKMKKFMKFVIRKVKKTPGVKQLSIKSVKDVTKPQH